jgi:hypothetical protein
MNRRRANQSSNPDGMASHQMSLLAVGVCGGWSTATVRVTGAFDTLAAGVLGMT